MSPAFITSSWGVEYKPREYFSLMSSILYDFDQVEEIQTSFSMAITLMVVLGNMEQE